MPKQETGAYRKVTFQATAEQHEMLQAMAEENGESLSSFARRASIHMYKMMRGERPDPSAPNVYVLSLMEAGAKRMAEDALEKAKLVKEIWANPKLGENSEEGKRAYERYDAAAAKVAEMYSDLADAMARARE